MNAENREVKGADLLITIPSRTIIANLHRAATLEEHSSRPIRRLACSPMTQYGFLPNCFPLHIPLGIRRPVRNPALVVLRVEWIGGPDPDSTSGTVTGRQG